MNINFPAGTEVYGDPFVYKTLCISTAMVAPPGGIPKYHEDDED
jgi:hypothetical protein